eukprot:TRINITY_DN65158_c0_g1_i1.p2 TRINITY_DN65158_c0_g1~~TRINITY_DN65158_c0_g1_i1.p2  ORF type:complete len:148 (+),score=19.88 TRINITY_DN65158_c0_g1_i1:82-525(+)
MGDRRPGDWDCVKCNDVQFARNTECRKCGEPKPRDAGSPPRRSFGERERERDPDGREMCGDFKRGNCFRDSCRFSHGGASKERSNGRGGGDRDRDRGGYDRDRDRGYSRGGCDRDRGYDRGSDRDRDRRDRGRRDDSRSRSRGRRRR